MERILYPLMNYELKLELVDEYVAVQYINISVIDRYHVWYDDHDMIFESTYLSVPTKRFQEMANYNSLCGCDA